MNADELKELRELIEFLKDNKIGEFDLERGDLKVRIKFAGEQPQAAAMDLSQLSRLLASTPAVPAVAPVAAAPASASSSTPSVAVTEDDGLHMVKSPIVGTFYESPSPGTPAFVKPGDQVEAGQVLCIIEAMKLMNEIEADVAGEVVKRIANNGQPVEYGQPLFAIKPH
ncbi:MAG: acetyl-CoA carboxylase biotin carboxyl carrier protein [Acidobacteriaceae bacterium]